MSGRAKNRALISHSSGSNFCNSPFLPMGFERTLRCLYPAIFAQFDQTKDYFRGEGGELSLAEARKAHQHVESNVIRNMRESPSKRETSNASMRIWKYSLSHRFYEEAQPTGNLSLRSLRLLSTSQAIEDAIHFIREVCFARFSSKIKLNHVENALKLTIQHRVS